MPGLWGRRGWPLTMWGWWQRRHFSWWWIAISTRVTLFIQGITFTCESELTVIPFMFHHINQVVEHFTTIATYENVRAACKREKKKVYWLHSTTHSQEESIKWIPNSIRTWPPFINSWPGLYSSEDPLTYTQSPRGHSRYLAFKDKLPQEIGMFSCR